LRGEREQVEGVLENKIFRIVKNLIICDIKPCRWLRGANVSEEFVALIFTVKYGMLIFWKKKRQQFYQRYIKVTPAKLHSRKSERNNLANM